MLLVQVRRWLTVLYVEVSGLRPGTVASQGGCTDAHCIIPRMHHSEFAASIRYVAPPGHAKLQILRRDTL